MTTCPNCGSIVMEGDPYCTHCGTTFQWSDDDEEMEKRQKVIESGDLFFCPYCHYEVMNLTSPATTAEETYGGMMMTSNKRFTNPKKDPHCTT